MKRKMNRGGRRPGAGRPYAGVDRTTVAVRLSPPELDRLDTLRGDRTRSEEIRRLIAEAKSQGATTPNPDVRPRT